MSQELIYRNPELQQLQNDGYEIEVRGGLLIVHHIPYLNSNLEMLTGTLIMPLETTGDIIKRPNSHTAHWVGQQPCNKDKSYIPSLVNKAERKDFGQGLLSNFFLSCHPDSKKGYDTYYEKITTYFNTISAPAYNFDKSKFCELRESIVIHSTESPLRYDDTNASRAGIVGINERLSSYRVAIVGLGGTGSYLLDFIAKTPVSEIHLYDNDSFDTHNAFRAPGAPDITQLRTHPFKVDYLSEIYGHMHSGIVGHKIRITKDNISELKNMDIVFVCVDDQSIRNYISSYLADNDITFIDSGMGLEYSTDRLSGLVRVTTGFYGHYEHLKDSYGDDLADIDNNAAYRTNIQIAELNALAAVLSIIQWKRMIGFYHDQTDGYLNFLYSVAGNNIIHQKYEN